MRTSAAMRWTLLVGVLALSLAVAIGSTGAERNDEPGPPQTLTVPIPRAPLELQALPALVREGFPPTATLTPTPAPTATPAPIPDQLSRAEMLELLEVTGWPPAQFERALAISWCESFWRPGAINIGDQPDGKHSTGLFQLWSGWYRASDLKYEDWRDPVVNASAALVAWMTSGWAPWTCAR